LSELASPFAFFRFFQRARINGPHIIPACAGCYFRRGPPFRMSLFPPEQRQMPVCRMVASGAPEGSHRQRRGPMQIQGEITKFRNDIGFGVIVADNGRKYRFTESEVINSASGLVGLSVDFVVVANRPTDIILLNGSPWTVFGPAGRS
jgi:hypothetical protein